MNAQAAQSASSAKVKTLPALQANQDPFGAPEAFGGMGWVNLDHCLISYDVSAVDANYFYVAIVSKDFYPPSSMVLGKNYPSWKRSRTVMVRAYSL